MTGQPDNVDEQRIPPKEDLLYPTLYAVLQLGGSASISEITAEVIDLEGFTESVQSELHLDGPQTELEYRLAWARTYLKGMGLLENSKRGVWALTEDGEALLSEDISDAEAEHIVRTRYDTYAAAIRERRARSVVTNDVPNDDPPQESTSGPAPGWKDELLEALLAMPPAAFERLAQRLLREAGFTSTAVTGRSGDGGIDGVGVYQVSLLSFPIYYQCKRYRTSVGPEAVRDFRGAMAGRSDQGLLITTATFTAGARAEATRDGAPPIDLIDGNRLCDLLKEYELGVRTTIRTVEDVSVDRSFFADLAD